jgi:hypothetical protein
MKENIILDMPIDTLTLVVKLRKQYRNLENALIHMDNGNHETLRISLSTGDGQPHSEWVDVEISHLKQRELVLSKMNKIKVEILTSLDTPGDYKRSSRYRTGDGEKGQ